MPRKKSYGSAYRRLLYKAEWAKNKYHEDLERSRARVLAKSRVRKLDPDKNRHDKDVRNERERLKRRNAQ